MGKDQSIDPDKYYRYVYMTGNTKEDKKLSMKGFHPCCWYKSLYPYTPIPRRGTGYYPEEILPLYPEGVLGEASPGEALPDTTPKRYYPYTPKGYWEKLLREKLFRILPRRDTTPKGYRGSISSG